MAKRMPKQVAQPQESSAVGSLKSGEEKTEGLLPRAVNELRAMLKEFGITTYPSPSTRS